MDMKSKQLVLVAMKMNNSYQIKMQFTQTKIINLEMFTNVRITICLVYELPMYRPLSGATSLVTLNKLIKIPL